MPASYRARPRSACRRFSVGVHLSSFDAMLRHMKFHLAVLAPLALLLPGDFAIAQNKPFDFDPQPLPNPATTTTTQEAPPVNVVAGLAEYIAPRLSAHEPMYFLYWPDSPDIKFQLSLKYQLLGPQNPLLSLAPPGSSLHIAYTQTTLWDFSAPSSPLYDTSYKPELLYLYQQNDPHWIGGMSHFDLQIGLQHESNGESGPDSRSINIVYVRPVFTFGDPGNHAGGKNDWFVAVGPRVFAYLSRNDENPDIDDYRGHGDLRVVVGERGGVQLAANGRVGNTFDHGALELDASCPLGRLGIRNPDLYLYVQYFLGYGETLRDYNQSGSSFRVGLALVR
jgi:phospholipase A1